METPHPLLDALAEDLHQRQINHTYRQRKILSSPQHVHVEVDGQSRLNFCSNDYLGLANHPDLIAAQVAALNEAGSGSGASHLVCGHHQLHAQLEQDLADCVGMPAALTFATGYMANLGVIAALVGRGDAVFADRLNHASLNDACILSRADFKRFRHNDLGDLERLLRDAPARRKLIVVDAVYSMDGDCAPLADLLMLAERYQAWLYVDDAHGFGVLGGGRGSLAEAKIQSPQLIYMATLGKAAGCSGAFVAGETVLIDWLINHAHTAIYTTAVPPANAAAGIAALRLIRQSPARIQSLHDNIGYFRAQMAGLQLDLMSSHTAIQPVLMPSSEQALAASKLLWERGLWVSAIRPPTVATPRLRITLSAAHSRDDIDQLIGTLKDIV
ncbi:8-amino-7-oxononanoate synthase [Burkholderiaceae bacterium DAT-1]|nr:8-amino-7-oxononanoate synthase [Burkholderiaceae bacterium DAT-1]